MRAYVIKDEQGGYYFDDIMENSEMDLVDLNEAKLYATATQARESNDGLLQKHHKIIPVDITPIKKKKIIHLQHRQTGLPACGASHKLSAKLVSKDINIVTCKSCRRTRQ